MGTWSVYPEHYPQKRHQAWWLRPIIPAIWEMEIRRTAVQGQTGKKVFETSSQPISWTWWYMHVIPST
jgi:hypothetical protein